MEFKLIWGIIFTIDYYRCSNMKEPIFTISKQENDLSIKSVTHQGLGYRVEVEKIVSKGSYSEEELLKIAASCESLNIQQIYYRSSNRYR